MTGFKLETLASSFKGDVLSDELVGEPNYATRAIGKIYEPTKTIMHGVAYLGPGKPLGYGRLKVSLQKLEEFENIPIAERGLGAMCGGYIAVEEVLSSGPEDEKTAEDVQAWGVIDKSKAKFSCGFYSSPALRNFYSVIICFDRTNVAAVSGFWRNGKAMIGPDINCDITDWGLNIKCKSDTGNFGIALAKDNLFEIPLQEGRCLVLKLIRIECHVLSIFVRTDRLWHTHTNRVASG